MKKALCAALAALMTVTFAAGCNNNSAGNGGKTKLLIGLPGGDGVTAYKVVENFKAATADKYEITTDEASWGDFTQKLKLQFVSKNDVTPVFFTDSMQAMTFGAQGAALDLTDWANAELDSSLYIEALHAITDSEGRLWGVPHALNSIGMLINKDILEERGIAYPTEDWTFDDMIQMAKDLTFDRDGDGKVDVYGINYGANITQGWLPFMTAVGVSPYKNDYRDSNIDDPKVKEAMVKYYECVDAGCIMPAADLAAFGGVEAAFAEGRIAMALVQSSSCSKINKFNENLNYDVQIMPNGWEGGSRPCVYVPNTWQVYAGVDEDVKVAALDWLKYYLSEESQMIVASEGPSGFPVMKSALDSITAAGRKPESIDNFYRGIDEWGITLLENPSSATTRTIVDNMTNKIYNGEDIDQWIETSHTDMQRELDYFYENQ